MDFGRLLTAMVTPFDKNLNVNYQEAKRIAEHLVSSGTEGIVIAGPAGESPTLSWEETERLFLEVKHTAGKKIPVFLGTGSNSTADTVMAVKRAARIGTDGVMLVSPYYNQPSQKGLYEHFWLAAGSSGLPVILYNAPGRTGCNLEPDTVARLAEIPQIQAIKEASGNLSQIAEIRRGTPEDFFIYSGMDGLALPMLALGAHGVISVASHVAGKAIANMLGAWGDGNVQLAVEQNRRLQPLFQALSIAPDPAPVKYAMSRLGFDTNHLRLPMVAIGERDERLVDRVLKGVDMV